MSVPPGVRIVDRHVVVFPANLFRVNLPVLRLLRDVQPSHVDRQRIVQAEQHADEHIDA